MSLNLDTFLFQVKLIKNGSNFTTKSNSNFAKMATSARLGQRGETHGKEGGSGLGLYHARKTAEELGGSLRLESTVGSGTSAIITLPRSKPPEWFVEKLALAESTQVAVLDDDDSVHQIWRGRFGSLKLQEKGIALHHFSTPDALVAWKLSGLATGVPVLFLVDYELLGHAMTGLDVIEKLGFQANSILVSSRYEESAIRERCTRLKVPLIPKGMAGFVPITMKKPFEKVTAVLLEDDSLVISTWASVARQNNKALWAYLEPESFFAALEDVDRDAPIYIDSNLANGIKGQDLIPRIRQLGFQTVYLATGYEPEKFAGIPGLTAVVGKKPPKVIGGWGDDDV